jgi:hypothetical protein
VFKSLNYFPMIMCYPDRMDKFKNHPKTLEKEFYFDLKYKFK